MDRSKLERASASLLSQGYAVVDDALPCAALAKLHGDMVQLRQQNGLRQHRFGFKAAAADAKPQIYTKPFIFEAELGDPGTAALQETFHSLDLQNTLRDALPALGLVGRPSDGPAGAAGGYDGITIKMQCNEGGGCFPLHYDNAGPPSRRRLTALFYLNPRWVTSDGGELELCPWLAPPVRVPPLYGRLVLFLSDVVVHRVLPSRARRYCFTVWIDGTNTNSAASLRLDPRASPCAALRMDPAQRILSRAVYAEEYAESIRECFRATPEQMAAVLESHERHVESQMTGSAAFARLVQEARASKPPPSQDEPRAADISTHAVGCGQLMVPHAVVKLTLRASSGRQVRLRLSGRVGAHSNRAH